MKGLVNKLGIMSYVYPGYSAAEMAKAIQANGMRYVQLDPRQEGLHAGDPYSVRRAETIRGIFAERGIEIVALSGYINLLDPDARKRETNAAVLERMIEVCEAYGAGYVATETGSLHPTNQWGYHPDNDSDYAWETLLAAVDRLRAAAVRHRAVFLLEGYITNVLSTPEKARRLIDELGTEGLGLVLDPFNYMTEPDLANQKEALERLFGLIGGLCPIAHAKDAVYTDKGFKSPRAGTGSMDWLLVAEAFARHTPDIPLILEHLQAEEAEETMRFVKNRFACAADSR